MYKHGKIIALLATIGWIGFVFAAFKGFHFWYAGFVFLLWLTLAALNYRHDTSLWLLKNHVRRFIKFYLFLVIFSFIADFIIGQKLTNLWTYPYYVAIDDWTRLYLIIYPFGGLSVLELVYFLSGLFGEKLVLVHRARTFTGSLINYIDISLDVLLWLTFAIAPLLFIQGVLPQFPKFFVYSVICWIIIGTLKFSYHLRNWVHWLAIFVSVTLLSVFLHEFPNTSAFEWKYNSAPILNQVIFDIPVWVFVGWYVLVLMMLRFWMYFVLHKRQK